MGSPSEEKVTYGVRAFRGEDDRFCGWQAYRIERGGRPKSAEGRTDIGDVQPWTIEGHQAALAICHAAADAEGIIPASLMMKNATPPSERIVVDEVTRELLA
jgi:hypothetical protein